MTENPLLVLTTCGDPDQARRLARKLIDGRLAACVNLIPGVESVYRWDGAVRNDSEVLVLIKTGAGRFDAVQEMIRTESGYELPEVLTVRVAGGSSAYLEWILASMATSSDK